MSRKIALTVGVLILGATSKIWAQSNAIRCVSHPNRVGECRKVHGRLSAFNGAPTFRVWVIGTKRVLGISDRDASPSFEKLPASLRKEVSFEHSVIGDFLFCPFSAEKPGVMQFGCVESAENTKPIRNE